MARIITHLAGVLLLVGCTILSNRLYKMHLLERPQALKLESKGGGTGSMYRLCDSTGAAIEKLTAVDFADGNRLSDIKKYYYNIENAKEYLLDGDDAVVVEKGPYTLKKFTINHDVDFTTSSITAADPPAANGAVEFDTASAYIVLDQETALTTNMKRSTTDMSLEWSGSEEELASLPRLEPTMPSHLSMSDDITNLSPAFLSVLGTFNDEFNLVLSLSCTTEQIANIELAGTGVSDKSQCSASQMNDFAETDCACCMLDIDYTTNVAAQGSFLNCNDFLDDSETSMSTLSLLASYDGGIAIKEAGDDKYDGSGDAFIQTKYEQASIHTPLIQTHSVNDITFGHPSAVVGKIVPAALLSDAERAYYDANDSTRGVTVDVATAMLTGQMDNDLPFKLGDMATYTKKVGAVCYSSCQAVASTDSLYDSPLGWTCSGNAPGRYETDEPDKLVLAGIDCRPYSSTFATVMQCSAIDTHLSANPNDPEYQACVCADGSSDWSAEGCCLAAGMLDGEDLTGNGCLFEVNGVLEGHNYAGTRNADGKTINIGAAMQAYINNEPSSKSSRFMCPAVDAAGLPEHEEFNKFESHNGQSSYDLYYASGRPRIQQDDKLTTNSSDVYSLAATTGSDLTYFPPKGLVLDNAYTELSPGTSRLVPHPVYVESGKLPVDFINDKIWGYMVRRAKVCGTTKCTPAARMRLSDTSFARSDGTDAMGRGHPFDGLQPIGHSDGPSDSGRPVYFHPPLYLGGDAELLSQQNNSHVDSVTAYESGNGVQIYRPISESSDPGAFTVGDANANYVLVQESAWENDEVGESDLRSYFDLEPASGIVARSRLRFGKSYSIWECDPTSNSDCARSKKSIVAASEQLCYQTSASSHYDNDLTQTEKDDLLAASGATGLTYACSAANVMARKVVGGKIMPHHWYEEFHSRSNKEDIEALHRFTDARQAEFRKWHIEFTVLFILLLLGAFMALGTACFESNAAEVVIEKKAAVDGATAD